MKDEPALLKAAKRLDQDALATIFDLYAPAIYRYSLRLCRDPIVSDNIVGDVFVQLLEKLSAGEGPLSNLRSYIYQIAYHLIVDRARTNHRLVPLEVSIDSHPGLAVPSTQSQVEDRDLMETLIDSMNNDLSEIQRHVIILRFLEDFSLRETAAIVGKTVNNVKVIQNRGITRLRRRIGLPAKNDQGEVSY
jgi:RNA polymerase sigma-70 factor (ECF subfamily)